MSPESEIRPPSSVLRRRWPAFWLCTPFLASILFAYCWFNTDIGRSSEVTGPWSLVDGPQQRIWLYARTKIPGPILGASVEAEIYKAAGGASLS